MKISKHIVTRFPHWVVYMVVHLLLKWSNLSCHAELFISKLMTVVPHSFKVGIDYQMA